MTLRKIHSTLWRNRSKIVTDDELKWLNIPTENKDKFYQKINETKIVDINKRIIFALFLIVGSIIIYATFG
ncbi:MAG: WbqC family protein [Lachnospiraceae bacterium]|nr:WbqC family protein [Lachnospiraceae bacterium]